MGRRWFVLEQTLATGEVREISRHWRERTARRWADVLNGRVEFLARIVTVLPDVKYYAEHTARLYYVRSSAEIEQAGARQ